MSDPATDCNMFTADTGKTSSKYKRLDTSEFNLFLLFVIYMGDHGEDFVQKKSNNI